ncbi:baseplate J/gp47 family protein [Apilactobacillus xinyiensis]|uniref:baseplate J/gp47 family protein n=1 Tax=Apilactobacillus xinyiensis TaxID=2841032 RepID=UPI00200E9DDA|nr:baseplate J/gp47 family protein [Apilactobacillus xinyiensis]MCL0330621.1 baseplate J/gp47 family protein [Apilactobacillus xinyiensis]
MDPQDLIDELLDKDFDYYLDKMLDAVDDKLDKREGSIIYDALAPAAQAMEEQNIDLAEVIKQSYTISAEGEFLDYKAFEKGASRELATNALVTAKVLDSNQNPINNVNIGDRFASIGDEPIFYTVTRINNDLTVLLQAEESGKRPNGYKEQILPITPNDSLSWAEIIEVSVPARNDEDDDTLRNRILSTDDYNAYGGNLADYQDMLKKIQSVGKGQIYTAWQGGGTVKVVILDNDNHPASNELLNEVKVALDPKGFDGKGYGLAPVGHRVTVVAPSVVYVDVNTQITTDGVVQPNELLDSIKTAISGYIDKQIDKWDVIDQETYDGYKLTIFRSQILAEILKVEHIINASLPKINGEDKDLTLTFTNDISQLPVMRDVTLDE